MTDDFFKQISQRGGDEETAEIRRIHEVADELRRCRQLHEAQFRGGKEDVFVKPQMTTNRTHITLMKAGGSRSTANYSLLTANSTAAFLVPPVPLIQHSAFNIQHWTYTFSAKEKDSETGLSYFGSRYYSSDLSIWLSVDPMSDKYPSLSPYTYCANNPVRCVDPDGEAYIPTGDEEAKAAAVAQIQNKTTLTVYIDEDGFLRADGEPKTKIDKFLQNSCDDNKVQVELDCRNDNLFSWSDGSSKGTENGGGYDGNFYNGDCVVARQCVCPKKLEEYDKSMGDEKAGLTMIHEMAEGYFGGKIAMRKKKGSPMAGVTGSTYDRAHKMATRIAWGNRGGVYREDDFRYNKDTGKIEKGPFKTLIGYARKP